MKKVLATILSFCIVMSSAPFVFKTSVSAATGEQISYFIDTLGPMATQDMKNTGILASLTMAQAILESGWGTDYLSTEANNLFGIKGTYNGEYVTVYTQEYYEDTGYVTIQDNFRKYPSWAESIADHSALFNNYDRYANLRGCTDYKLACKYVREDGYATSPTYTESLIELIEQYHLYDYDKIYVEVSNKYVNRLATGKKTLFKDNGNFAKTYSYYAVQICDLDDNYTNDVITTESSRESGSIVYKLVLEGDITDYSSISLNASGRGILGSEVEYMQKVGDDGEFTRTAAFSDGDFNWNHELLSSFAQNSTVYIRFNLLNVSNECTWACLDNISVDCTLNPFAKGNTDYTKSLYASGDSNWEQSASDVSNITASTLNGASLIPINDSGECGSTGGRLTYCISNSTSFDTLSLSLSGRTINGASIEVYTSTDGNIYTLLTTITSETSGFSFDSSLILDISTVAHGLKKVFVRLNFISEFCNDWAALSSFTANGTYTVTHTHTCSWVCAVESTCTVAGKEQYICSYCNEIFDEREIPATGHTPGEWQIINEPSCTEKGYKVCHCTVCGTTVDSAYIKRIAHTPSEYVEENGTLVSRCTVCNVVLDTKEIPTVDTFVPESDYSLRVNGVTVTGSNVKVELSENALSGKLRFDSEFDSTTGLVRGRIFSVKDKDKFTVTFDNLGKKSVFTVYVVSFGGGIDENVVSLPTVAYSLRSSGIDWTGDTANVRMSPGSTTCKFMFLNELVSTTGIVNDGLFTCYAGDSFTVTLNVFGTQKTYTVNAVLCDGTVPKIVPTQSYGLRTYHTEISDVIGDNTIDVIMADGATSCKFKFAETVTSTTGTVDSSGLFTAKAGDSFTVVFTIRGCERTWTVNVWEYQIVYKPTLSYMLRTTEPTVSGNSITFLAIGTNCKFMFEESVVQTTGSADANGLFTALPGTSFTVTLSCYDDTENITYNVIVQ